MADLVPLDAEPPGEGVVALLEQWLDMARAGRLSSVAIAGVYRDGDTGDGWSRLHSLPTQIGAVAILQAKLTGLISEKVTHE